MPTTKHAAAPCDLPALPVRGRKGDAGYRPAENDGTGLRLPASLPGLYLTAALFLFTPTPASAERAPEPDPTPIEFDMTLKDAIGTALEHNRDLLDRHLDREVRKFSLDVAEDRYRPLFSVELFAETDRRDRRAGGGADGGHRGARRHHRGQGAARDGAAQGEGHRAAAR